MLFGHRKTHEIVADTPVSEPTSVYFDAPIASFNNSTAEIPNPEPTDMAESSQLPPPVHTSYPAHTAPEPSLALAPISMRDQPPAGPSRFVQHPNGSEGWLPTEEPGHPSGASIPTAPGVPHAPGSVLQSPQQPFDEHREAVVTTNLNTLATHGEPMSAETMANTTHNSGPIYGGGNGFSPAMPTAVPSGGGQFGEGYALQDQGVQPGAPGATTLDRSASRRSVAFSGMNTLGSQKSINAFTNGAGATGPLPNPEAEIRARQAGATLSPKERRRINAEEEKNNKRLSKIIKGEAKTEKRAMANAITELEDLQLKQKGAIKAEERLLSLTQKQGVALAKAKAALISAQMRFDSLTAENESTENTLAKVRADAHDITQRMQNKSAEVEALRRTLEVDERERGVRLGSLSRRR